RTRRRTPGRTRPSAFRRSPSRAPQYEFREEADAKSGRPLGAAGGFAVGVGGSGDIEMGPREAIHELAQEPSGRDGTGRTSAGILHVRHVGFVQVAEFIPQGQRPTALAGQLTRFA